MEGGAAGELARRAKRDQALEQAPVRPTADILSESERLANAEAFISNLGIRTVFEGSEGCYRPSTDAVFMPPFASFRDPASFYGVWLHENGHASGAKHRLDRDLSGRFGSAAYAAEECCGEILSGLILADLGIAHHPPPIMQPISRHGSRS